MIQTGQMCKGCGEELVQNQTDYGMYCRNSKCDLQYQTQVMPQKASWMPPIAEDIIKDMYQGVRTFPTGATRSPAEGKPEYAGYLSPNVIEAFGAYMMANQVQSNGEIRCSRNWQKGIPLESYMQSMFRHFHAVWKHYEAAKSRPEIGLAEDQIITDLMALLFNVQGMAHEILKGEKP